MLESKAKSEFIEEIRRLDGYVSNLSASMYMSGQPDMMIVSKFGITFQCEAKVWRGVAPPTAHQHMVKLLRGPQINVITKQLWRRGAYCPIIAFSAADETMCFICHATNAPVFHIAWRYIAKEFAERESV